MHPKLVSNSLRSLGNIGLLICLPPPSRYWNKQVCATVSNLYSAGNQMEAFVHARQAVYLLSHDVAPSDSFELAITLFVVKISSKELA